MRRKLNILMKFMKQKERFKNFRGYDMKENKKK